MKSGSVAENRALHVDPVGPVRLQIHREPVGVEVVTIYVAACPFHEDRLVDFSPGRESVRLHHVPLVLMSVGRSVAPSLKPPAKVTVSL